MTDTTFTIEDLTTIADQLIANTSTHLAREFEAGRITGTDYANVYLAGINTAMAQAQQFMFQKDMVGYQTDVAYEQKLQAVNQTEVSDGTKANQIALVQVQKDTADEQLIMMKERHGMNGIPQFTQG